MKHEWSTHLLRLREVLPQDLEGLLGLLRVLDEEEVLLLELREDVQELLRVLEVQRQLLAAVLVLPVPVEAGTHIDVKNRKLHWRFGVWNTL